MWKEINSPCRGACEIDENTNLCKHCLRTIDEIQSWPYFNDNDKREVYKLIEKRKNFLEECKDPKPPVLEWLT